MTTLAQRYVNNLKYHYELKPGLFMWPKEEIGAVAAKMLEALRDGPANRESWALIQACKQHGIRRTNKAIRETLVSEGIEFVTPVIGTCNVRVPYLGD